MKRKILIIIILLLLIMAGIIHDRIVASRDKGMAVDWNADHNITGDVDMDQHSWKNQVIENLNAFPGGPVEGQVVWRADLNIPYIYDGAAWDPLVYTDADARAAINNIFGADGKADANIDMDVHKIINVVDPAANQDAATKKYVDDETTLTKSQDTTGDIFGLHAVVWTNLVGISEAHNSTTGKVLVMFSTSLYADGGDTIYIRLTKDGAPINRSEREVGFTGSEDVSAGAAIQYYDDDAGNNTWRIQYLTAVGNNNVVWESILTIIDIL